MGHAESACTDDLVDRIARWVTEATQDSATPRPISQATTPDAAA
jgi:hypothetical protein